MNNLKEIKENMFNWKYHYFEDDKCIRQSNFTSYYDNKIYTTVYIKNGLLDGEDIEYKIY